MERERSNNASRERPGLGKRGWMPKRLTTMTAGLSIYEGTWLAGFILQFVIRYPHHKRNQFNVITKQNLFTVDMIALGLMFLTMGPLPFFYTVFLAVKGKHVRFGSYHLPKWARQIGVALTLVALFMFWRSHEDLGQNWSVQLEVREGHSLVTTGVYTYVRHPMYTAIWCFAIAQPLLLPNCVLGFPVVPSFLMMTLTRILEEEQLMRDEFGIEYDRYCANTARLIPFLL